MPLLVQCALCAFRKKSNPEIRRRYENPKKRRGHKRAIIAIAGTLLTAIYNILKKNEPFLRAWFCVPLFWMVLESHCFKLFTLLLFSQGNQKILFFF